MEIPKNYLDHLLLNADVVGCSEFLLSIIRCGEIRVSRSVTSIRLQPNRREHTHRDTRGRRNALVSYCRQICDATRLLGGLFERNTNFDPPVSEGHSADAARRIATGFQLPSSRIRVISAGPNHFKSTDRIQISLIFFYREDRQEKNQRITQQSSSDSSTTDLAVDSYGRAQTLLVCCTESVP